MQDKFRGCLLGLALGDACGAPYESGPLERMIWSMIGWTRRGERRFSDDTQMSLDVAECVIAHQGRIDCDAMAKRFAHSYAWHRGYGPGAARILKRIKRGMPWDQANTSVYESGSLGNGGAMRSPVLGLVSPRDPESAAQLAREVAAITHAHPLGQEGAALIAAATTSALSQHTPLDTLAAARAVCHEAEFLTQLDLARRWLVQEKTRSAQAIRDQLGNGIQATQSCVSALYIGLASQDHGFEDLLLLARQGKGDVDTIGAMAGALWGARHGAAALPVARLKKLEQRGRIEEVADQLHALVE